MQAANAAANKELVRKAITELFINRDVTALDRYWGETYVQHNPAGPNGRDALPGLIKSLGPGFKYEVGMMLADGDLVAVHGRYTGFGPKPLIAVDMFRVKGWQASRALGCGSGGSPGRPNEERQSHVCAIAGSARRRTPAWH